ncbi:MAG: futalosine hydrolase [Chitinophagaceae bacterium]
MKDNAGLYSITIQDICSMYILLTAATKMEIQPTIDFLRQHDFQYHGHEIDVLITGIGSISTTYLLTYNIHNHRPDYLLQAGIAGSFSPNYPPGSLVFVNEDISGDVGVEENGMFKDVTDMGLQQADHGPYTGKYLVNPYCSDWEEDNVPFVRSITINEITTRASRIEQLQQKYSPVVESMEGAAFHYTALMESIPFMQIRSISNFVGERDKSKWQMKPAIDVLNAKLIEIIKNLD